MTNPVVPDGSSCKMGVLGDPGPGQAQPCLVRTNSNLACRPPRRYVGAPGIGTTRATCSQFLQTGTNELAELAGEGVVSGN